jgi:hypothetical protein
LQVVAGCVRGDERLGPQADAAAPAVGDVQRDRPAARARFGERRRLRIQPSLQAGRQRAPGGRPRRFVRLQARCVEGTGARVRQEQPFRGGQAQVRTFQGRKGLVLAGVSVGQHLHGFGAEHQGVGRPLGLGVQNPAAHDPDRVLHSVERRLLLRRKAGERVAIGRCVTERGQRPGRGAWFEQCGQFG